MALLRPVIQGKLAFDTFAFHVQSDFRYFRADDVEQILAEVLATSSPRRVRVARDWRFWRARLGAVWDENAVTAEADGLTICGANRPHPIDQMKPMQGNWGSQAEGRANPRGISYLYLATNIHTALAEVRPWIGSHVSMGEFAVVRDLTLIDCSKYHAGLSALADPSSASREDGLWSAIDRAFAKPVGRGDNPKDYIPTQILSEFFKSHGFDGIEYKSLLDDEGHNIALFRPNDAELRSCSLLEVSRQKFEFADKDCTYCVGVTNLPAARASFAVRTVLPPDLLRGQCEPFEAEAVADRCA
jgi:RES domain